MKNTKIVVEEKFGLTRNDLGYILHTALRKGCDSKESSLCWNVVNYDDFDKEWKAFLDIVWSNLESREIPALESCLVKSIDSMDFGTVKKNIFMLSFQILTEADLEGIACFIGEK